MMTTLINNVNWQLLTTIINREWDKGDWSVSYFKLRFKKNDKYYIQKFQMLSEQMPFEIKTFELYIAFQTMIWIHELNGQVKLYCGFLYYYYLAKSVCTIKLILLSFPSTFWTHYPDFTYQ